MVIAAKPKRDVVKATPLKAIKELHENRVTRWLEVSVNDPDIADITDRFLSNSIGSNKEASKADTVSRIQFLFDPSAPLRYQSLCAHFDAFGTMMLDAMNQNNSAAIQSVTSALRADFHTYWADLYPELRPDDTYKLLWQLQKARECAQLSGFGFGMERLVYELNEGLACQSPLVKDHHIREPSDILKLMDSIAAQKHHDTLADRHLAAFLAKELGLTREVGFKELHLKPQLQRSPELVVIRMLGQMQANMKNPKMIGLASWCAFRISNLISEFHNRKTRKAMRRDLRAAAMTGVVNNVLGIMVNKSATEGDIGGYQRAIQLYQYNTLKINNLKKPKIKEDMARDLGGRLATFISYCILFVTIFILLNNYQHDLF